MRLDRRSLLKYAVASAAGAVLATPNTRPLHAAEQEFPMGDLEAHVRMRGNLRGERTYWYYKGTVFGNLWGQSTEPMLGVEGVSFSIIDSLAGGRYRYSLTEAGYYSDPVTGEISKRVRNPFNGEYYEPKNYLSPQTIIFEPDLSVTPVMQKPPPGLEYRGVISPVRTFKNSVWSSEDLFVRMPLANPANDPEQPAFRVQTSLAMLTSDRRELLDPDLEFVPCQLNYQTLGTWRPWMGMGAKPGMISWRMTGTKCKFGDIPGPIAERIARDHEGFFG